MQHGSDKEVLPADGALEQGTSGGPLRLIATCAFGLEALVKRELIALGYDARGSRPGAVSFSGDWSAVCRANLWLRCADRVLVEVAEFEARDFETLFETVKAIEWQAYLTRDAAFPVVGRSRLSTLSSVPACQRSVKRAIVDALQRGYDAPLLPETGATYQVAVALLKDIATLTIDTTGRSLHRRGYRRLVAAAPLKETLAAAMIQLSVWNPERPLIDPFCGSGTIPIEAALIARNMAPGINRRFAAQDWPQIPGRLWSDAVQEAMDARRLDIPLQIAGTDIDPRVLKLARFHAEQAEVAGDIHFQEKPFDQLRSKRQHGCVIANPPYGERLEDRQRLRGLYRSIPQVLQRLPSWSFYLLTSMPDFEGLIQKTASRRRKLFNGRIECTYYQFLGPPPARRAREADAVREPLPGEDGEEPPVEAVVDGSSESRPTESAKLEGAAEPAPAENGHATPQTTSASRNAAPVFGGLSPKAEEQAALFHARLVKRARHLRRWPSKRGITCYRLYERDIPELPFVVDRYEDYLHITEYERPHERDLGTHAAWLELMKRTAARALELPIQHVFLKHRRRLQGGRERQQYERVDSQGKRIAVREGGLRFWVNLSDYVDTGLFLDHRVTRQMVRDESAGRHFLNLFAYTGAFSVYAAAGGAASTTTVDLSSTYLDWARNNMQENGFAGPMHRFIVRDAVSFLEQLSDDQRFDLAVVDPPTYSNSKRTDQDWDVQRGHADLLRQLATRMNPGGVVYFSTNFRRFKLAESELTPYEIREISRQTVPEDFRNQRIHRCWRMTLPAPQGN